MGLSRWRHIVCCPHLLFEYQLRIYVFVMVRLVDLRVPHVCLNILVLRCNAFAIKIFGRVLVFVSGVVMPF